MGDFVEGGIVGLFIALIVLRYFKFMDRKLMEQDCSMNEVLKVSLYYRSFVLVFLLACVVATGAVIEMILSGGQNELLVGVSGLALFLLVGYWLSFPAFFIKTTLVGDTLRTLTPFGEREVSLADVNRVRIRDDFNCFELSDDKTTIRFCQYVEGKRALIEHIVKHAPNAVTGELKQLLEQAV